MVTKKRFSQAQRDELVTRKAKAILALRKARQALGNYDKTHKSR